MDSVNSIEQNQQATQASQANHVREAQRSKLLEISKLIISGPGLVDDQLKPEPGSHDNELRPEDNFERLGPLAVPPPPPQGPALGPPVPLDNEDLVLPVDGRGAAVAVQNHCDELLKNGDAERFAATAQALGVPNLKAFENAVEEGNALNTFKHVDSNRVVFTDANFKEVDPTQFSALAKAQLVIKPSFEVPVAPEVKTPEVVKIDPNLRLQKALEQVGNPEEALKRRQTEPASANANDQTNPIVS
ncbi:MAG: hypothetical protein ACAI44_32485 [Candidatus Sericytochromatia bacterium]